MVQNTILYDSEEAAHLVTGLSMWIDSHGLYFRSEDSARWSGCTHTACPDCGEFTNKFYTACDYCREERSITRYNKREIKEWNAGPIYSSTNDIYFNGLEEVYDFLHDLEVTPVDINAYLRPLLCEPVYLKPIEYDYFSDELAEDQELPVEIERALDQLNIKMREVDPVSWTPGEFAVVLELESQD